MAMKTSDRLGHHEIVAPLGSGGMGEVYRAKDTRLGREVALKVLPERLAQNPEALGRFQREAQAVAALSHPNILAQFDFGVQEGVAYSVTELLEGEDLRTRMAGGPLPVRKAVEFGIQIAQGLAAAHEKGVVHRDLKPDNLFVTRDGRIKILDFGLAKIAGETAFQLESEGPTAAPPTQPGAVMGTVGYMSPEQVKGKPIDHRSDLFSFGAVLYEMLSGRRAFKGDSAVETMTAILKEEPPDLAETNRALPPGLDRVVRHCLEKNPEERFQSARDVAFNLEALSGLSTISAAGLSPLRGGRPWRRLLLTGLGAVVLLALGGFLWSLLGPSGKGGSDAVTRLSVACPADLKVTNFLMTPSGKALILLAQPAASEGQARPASRLYLRRLDSYDLKAIPGTGGAVGMVVSPDERWLAFIATVSPDSARGRLLKVPLDGSAPPVAVGDWDNAWTSAAWLPDGRLLISSDNGSRFLYLPMGSGSPGAPFAADAGGFHGQLESPRLLPGGKAVLLNAVSYGSGGYQMGVAVMDLASHKAKILVENGGNAVYVPGGTLLFSRQDTLLAVPFSERRLALKGSPVALEAGLRTPAPLHPALFYVGRDGTLAYLPGGTAGLHRTLGLITPDGQASWIQDRRAFNGQLALTRDGAQVAVGVTNSETIDEIWAASFAEGLLRPLVAIPRTDVEYPVWSPDGRSIAYGRVSGSDQDGVYIQRADGAGEAVPVFKREGVGVTCSPAAWSPDGRTLLLHEVKQGRYRVLAISLAPDGSTVSKPADLLRGAFSVVTPAFSPDGRYLAYAADPSGHWEVYVTPAENGLPSGAAIQVSAGGGVAPLWSRDGKRLSFVSLLDRLMFADLSFSPALDASRPREGYGGDVTGAVKGPSAYAWLPDGRFLFVKKDAAEGEITQVNLVLHWVADLDARLHAGRH
ncbi:MAG: protein kinase [Acidobacteriota bacterium]